MEKLTAYITKEEMYEFIKVKDYYTVSDVVLALRYEDFKELPFPFLQYILHVLTPEAGYNVPGEKMEDLTVKSIYTHFDKEEYYRKIELFLPELLKRLTETCIGLNASDGGWVKDPAVETIRTLRAFLYRNYIGRENPSKILNKYIREFNQGYLKGLTELGKEDTAKVLNKVRYFYDSDYDDKYRSSLKVD